MDNITNKTQCIIVAINEKYVAIFSVLLESIIENSKNNENYEIVVLYTGLSDESKKTLKNMVHSDNVWIRFLNVSKKIEGYNFFVKGENNKIYLSKEAYFRLLAPELLPEYKVALYLDSDIIVLSGWTDIFQMDLNEYLLAAVPDIWDNWKCYSARYRLAEYRKKELCITNFGEYFNSGVMLLNLDEMRKTFREGELLKIAASKDWKKHDQDVLNLMCKGRVHLLDYKWNLIECPGTDAFAVIPEEEYHIFKMNQNDRKIVHFASRKPWKIRGVQNENDFWKFAVKSHFFDVLFSEFIEIQMQQGKYFEEIVFKNIKNNKIGVKFIVKCIMVWIKNCFNKCEEE